jgi:hypothetical protein
MRKFTAGNFFLALAMLIGGTRLHGQGFMIGAGASLPTGDFGQVAKTGWIGMAGLNFPMGSKAVSIRIDGDYSQNSSKFEGGGSDKLISGFGGVQLGLGEKSSHPYLVGQVGYMKATCDGCSGALGFAAGAGFTTGSMFVEGRYASASKNGGTTSVIYATIGLMLGGKKK